MTSTHSHVGRRFIGLGIFFTCWGLYLVIGLYLTVQQQFFFGDALSRVQAAQSVLFSRDPHLSAIGFIFTPLTALVQLPMIALSPTFPAITADGISAVIMSSGFMAGSVAMLAGIARDRRLPLTFSVIVVLAYAANPMIALYAGNGMSEAPALFCLLWCMRHLIRWVDTDDVHDLAIVGLALALGFLTRYDFGAGALAVGVFVAVVSYRRPRSDRRRDRAIVDTAVALLPTAATFMMWSMTSWVVTGEMFAQFTSEYGNTAIIETSGGTGSDGATDAALFAATEMLLLAPLLPVLLGAVAIIRYRRQRLYPLLAALACGIAVLGFQSLLYTRGATFGFLRFYIMIIPVAAVVTLLAVPARRIVPWRRLGQHAQLPAAPTAARHPWRDRVLGTVAALTAAIALPVTLVGMASPETGPQEFALRAVVAPNPNSVDPLDLNAQETARSFSTERELAKYLDRLELPDGSVLTDTVYGFAVVVRSVRPRQFVIPSDQDFTEILNNPADSGVRYLLTVPNSGRGKTDALNIRYPMLYANGAHIASLQLEAPNQGANLPTWRVYRVIGSGNTAP